MAKQKGSRSSTNTKNTDHDSAHEQADKDMARDPDNIHSPNDDLDEGELARLGENPKGI